MAKIPKKPEEIFPEITGDYQKIFGEDLISIILYGSGAGEDYVPGKSDLNFLITLTDQGDRAARPGTGDGRPVAETQRRDSPLHDPGVSPGSQDAYPDRISEHEAALCRRHRRGCPGGARLRSLPYPAPARTGTPGKAPPSPERLPRHGGKRQKDPRTDQRCRSPPSSRSSAPSSI